MTLVDLSQIPEDKIRALEEAMRVLGVSGVTVDGNPDDLTQARLRPFLDKLSLALGKTGTDFAQGAGFDPEAMFDPEVFDARLDEITTAVEGFRDSPHLGLVQEILSDDPDVAAMEAHLTAIGIPAPAAVAAQIDNSWFSSNVILQHATKGVFAQAAASDPNFAKLRDILGEQAFTNIEQTIDVMNNADSWLDVVEAFKPEPAATPATPEEVASAAAALEAEEDVVQATADTAVQGRIRAVETVLGIAEPDGVWGAEEQAKLKTKIAEMQRNDDYWVGRKDGVYTEEFAQYVRGDDPNFDNFSDTDKAFFAQLKDLSLDNVELIAEADKPRDSEAVQDAIATVEKGLVTLIPLIQRELDQKRSDAQGLIESIQGRNTSDLQREAAQNKLLELAEKDQSTLTPKDLADMEEAQGVLNSRDIGANIGNFIDDFLGLGQTTIGRRMVQTGKNFSIQMIQGQLDGIADLPPADSINPDGNLDLNEQTALQGVTYLLAKRFGIGGSENWRYTPKLGEALLKKVEGLDDSEKLLLLSDEERAAYEAEGDEAARKKFLDDQYEAKLGEIKDLLAAMDVLHDEGVLVPHQLYHAEEIEIPKLTQEIFDDFMQEHQNDPQALNMLNMLTYEFTEGLDLTAVMDEGYVFPDGVSPIDPTKTIAERFKEGYQDGIDTEYMLQMLDTLPFGTDARRDEMKAVVANAKAAVQAKKDEDPDATIEILASIYGNAIEKGVNAMNDNDAMGADYLFIRQRPRTIDPRLGLDDPRYDPENPGPTRFLHADSKITVEDIYEIHAEENGMFMAQSYGGTYFRDELGDTYVAAVDYVSNTFTVEKIDFDAWRAALADPDNQPKPGENRRDYYTRLDEALSDVSGHDLILQNHYEGLKQMSLVRGVNGATLLDYLEARPIPTFETLKANTFLSNAAKTAFDAVVGSDDVSQGRTPDSETEFRANGDEITAPDVLDEPQNNEGITPPVTAPDPNAGVPRGR